MHVEDDVAIVGHNALAVHRVAAELDQLTGHMAARHGDYLDRQREGTQHWNKLAAVGDADEGLGYRRYDFLAGKGRAATFDQVQVGIALVGTVDIKLQLADAVQLIDRDAMAFQALGRGLGAGHRAIECALVLGQGVDEEVGGRTGADADDAFFIQLRQNEVDSGLGDGLFELVLGHAGSERGRGR